MTENERRLPFILISMFHGSIINARFNDFQENKILALKVKNEGLGNM